MQQLLDAGADVNAMDAAALRLADHPPEACMSTPARDTSLNGVNLPDADTDTAAAAQR